MTEVDLTVVEMTPPEMPAALAQGQIAGYCVAEPFGTQALLLGTGHILARSDELWEDSPCCALVFHGDFAEEHTELARAAVRAYLDASEHLTEHPEEQTVIAGHFLKTQPDVLADRVVVMTPNPGQVRCVISVALHGRRDCTSADFLKIRDRIFAAFEMKPKDGTEYYI